ncbi:hypothetical protein NA56DRAFT_718903 [Hyaloscypha hepaticicola]|uniref:Uncharacterized protein n=1 Tax=Hyaloscypha hepaticicola TaxID=2082293 RepID=A0A2J6Q7D5_9HELO|nr:hypothetical protein NA56DRAFT_718903 [Hyaloscypha hepaticicola]
MSLSRTPTSPFFMSIPTELQSKILSLACAHHETIIPQQFAPGSAKFTLQDSPASHWENGFWLPLTRKDGALPKALSAFDITRTCRKIHDMIEGDNMFYTENEFEFFGTQDLINYLVALPSRRRNAIRSIRVKYDYLRVPVSAFTILAVCYRLENITLDITGMTNFFDPDATDFSQAPGYAQLMTLRGLKSFKLVYGNKTWTLMDDILARIPNAWVSENQAESEKSLLRSLQQIEHNIGQAISQPRPINPLISAGELGAAMNQAEVRVWGDTINNALAPPTQANSGLSLQVQHNVTEGVSTAANPIDQPRLSETEEWQVLDRTHLASWDV